MIKFRIFTALLRHAPSLLESWICPWKLCSREVVPEKEWNGFLHSLQRVKKWRRNSSYIRLSLQQHLLIKYSIFVAEPGPGHHLSKFIIEKGLTRRTAKEQRKRFANITLFESSDQTGFFERCINCNISKLEANILVHTPSTEPQMFYSAVHTLLKKSVGWLD